MPTDQFGFPIPEIQPPDAEEEEIWRVLRLEPPDPLPGLLEDIQSRSEIVTRTTVTADAVDSIGRLLLVGTPLPRPIKPDESMGRLLLVGTALPRPLKPDESIGRLLLLKIAQQAPASAVTAVPSGGGVSAGRILLLMGG